MRLLFVVLMLIGVCGCQSTQYYWQAASGHMGLMHKREPIVEVLKRDDVTAKQRHKFAVIAHVRRFSHDFLHLPVGHQYTTYIPMDGAHVVWSVYATPKYSLEPLSWCYWFVGCMHYRGYFDVNEAKGFESDLVAQGYDTYVAPSMAYSTLGTFSDSVLSSFLSLSDVDLAALIIHELSHSKVFIQGDTSFNESFATVVEQEGLRRWLKDVGSGRLMEGYERRRDDQNKVVDLILDTKSHLRVLYQKPSQEGGMAELKRGAFKALKEGYLSLRQGMPYSGYDGWFSQPLNNASLITVSTYHGWVPALQVLLARVHGDMDMFYREAAKIGSMTPKQRLQIKHKLESAIGIK
jgi:predicted aminopeptidase